MCSNRMFTDVKELAPKPPAAIQPVVVEEWNAATPTPAATTNSSVSNTEKRSTLNELYSDESVTSKNKSVMDILDQKITWAGEELRTSSNVKYNIELCEMIKSASEARQALKRY